MIKVLKKGLYTSIQDLGRVGFRDFGVPISGAMDSMAAKLSNSILGNNENDAIIEATLQGPQLQFLTATKIAITGADLSPTLNGEQVKNNYSLNINRNDVLEFGKKITGVRCYIAVAGGFQTHVMMKSRSSYQGITNNSIIDNGDEISFYSSFKEGNTSSFSYSHQQSNYSQPTLEAHKGPEFGLLNELQKERLRIDNFTIGINNRMAYQLQESLENKLKSILSSAVLPGTVQLTPSGKMMILMRDCQTTGGYPRILQLTEEAICCLSQKMQNDTVSFKL